MGDMKKSAAAFSAALVMMVSSVPLAAAADAAEYEESGQVASYEASDSTPADPVINGSGNDSASAQTQTQTAAVGDVTSFKASDVTTTGYTIRWNKVEGADGYHVYVMSKGKPKLFKTTTKTGLKLKVKAGCKNTFRVCAFKNTESGTVEGNYQQRQFASKPEQIQNFTYARSKRGGLVFRWDPVAHCTKYQLFYSTEKNGTYQLFKEVAPNKDGVSSGLMPKGKSLYFKMRAVTVAKDMTSYGKCSKNFNATVFNTDSVDTVMDGYSNSKSIKVVNGQGFKLSDSLKNRLSSQLTYLGGDSSYVLYDIDSGAAICYNADTYFMPASSVKAPFMMYCLKRMDQGYSNLDTKVTYTAAQKHGGSGVIQNAAFGTQYTIRTLFQYIADYSDNVAYYMLQDHFGIDGYNNYISGLGCKTSLKTGVDRWGVVCATDAAREWNDIWTYLRNGPQAQFARKIYSSTCGANFRNQLGGKYTVYEKSGWTDGDTGYHNETALIRATHPYILVCLSNRPSSQRMMNVAQVSEEIHNEMWKQFK